MPTSRRDFVRNVALQGLALVVTVPQLACRRRPTGPPLAPNQWLEIDPAGTITFVLDKAEMGQGVAASLPMIMAEELGVDLAAIRVVPARPGPRFTEMGTSGSGSVIDAWFGHRKAAAAARSMLISAAATEWNVPPTECDTERGRVIHRPSRRSRDFGALVAAARALPVPEEPAFRPAADYRLLGTRVADPELPAIVTGATRFGIDVRLPGMTFATIARCPAHGGRLRHHSADRATAVPGVRQVLTVPSGVAVVADSTWAAIQGRQALDLEWDTAGHDRFDNAAGWRTLEQALTRGGKVARQNGNASAALRGAARRLTADYRWAWQAHAAIEPLSAVARIADDRCEIWAGTQNPNRVQRLVAEALGMPEERVDVNPLRLGGGFGRRIAVDYAVEAALVARAIGAPVQVVWTREDDFAHDWYNTAQLNRLDAGLDHSGNLVAWRHHVADFNLSMFGDYNPNYDPAADGDPWGAFDSPYHAPDLEVRLALAPTPVPSGAWRSVTYPAAVMARECFIDEIAAASGLDPVALRLKLIPSPGTIERNGVRFDNGDRLRRVLQLAADRAGWSTALPPPNDGRQHGRGIACNQYHRGTMVAQVAEISVGQSGDLRVNRIVSAVDCGQIANLAGLEQQFEGGIAWALSTLFGPGVRFEQGRTVTRSFADYPILRIDQMPVVETHVVTNPIRPFGVGEQPVPAVIPAVLNAYYAATGRRIRSLPLPQA